MLESMESRRAYFFGSKGNLLRAHQWGAEGHAVALFLGGGLESWMKQVSEHLLTVVHLNEKDLSVADIQAAYSYLSNHIGPVRLVAASGDLANMCVRAGKRWPSQTRLAACDPTPDDDVEKELRHTRRSLFVSPAEGAKSCLHGESIQFEDWFLRGENE